MSNTTKGGVMAAASRAAEWVKPCAKPRRTRGTQRDIARVAFGIVPASPSPTIMRATIIDAMPPTSPVNNVPAAQNSAANRQHAAGTDFIAGEADDDLEDRVAIPEGRTGRSPIVYC